MATVAWTRPALADLRRLREWIARDSPRHAALEAQRIRAATERLAQFPESGRIVPERPGGPYREVIVAPYRVIYRYVPERNLVAVVTVIHSRQLLPPLADDS